MKKDKPIFVYTSIWDKNGTGHSSIDTLIAFDNFNAAYNMMLHEMNYIESKYNGTIHSFNEGNTKIHADVTLNIWDDGSGRYIRWRGEVQPTFVFDKANFRQNISGVSGCSGLEYNESELLSHVEDYLRRDDFTIRDLINANNIIGRYRCSLSYADYDLYTTIQDAINDFCADYGIEQTEDEWIDAEDIFYKIEL